MSTDTPKPSPQANAPLPTWRMFLLRWGFPRPKGMFIFSVAVFLFVTLGICGSLLLVLVRGDGHEPPDHRGSKVTALTLCPSAARDMADAQESSAAWVTEGGWNSVTLAEGLCVGEPQPGEVQIRDERDIVTGWTPLNEHHGSAVTRPKTGPVERGIIYLMPRASNRKACTLRHEIGHAVYGLADATAATSIMHEDCGSSWTLVHRSNYPE